MLGYRAGTGQITDARPGEQNQRIDHGRERNKHLVIGAREVDHDKISRTAERTQNLRDNLRDQRHVSRPVEREHLHTVNRRQASQQLRTIDTSPGPSQVGPAHTPLLLDTERDVEPPAELVPVHADRAQARLCGPHRDGRREHRSADAARPANHSNDVCRVHATRVPASSARRSKLWRTCGRWQEPRRGCGYTRKADNRDGPRRGTSGAVDAPNSGGRSWRARTLNPKGECAYQDNEPCG